MAVNNAVAETRPKAGLTLRVDNGTQYTSRDFRSSAAALGITIQYSCANTPEQNGHIESFRHTLKKEYVWPREFADIHEDKEAPDAAFVDYNRCRIHSALKYLTPSEFAERHRQDSGGTTHDITGGDGCE